MTKKLFVGAPVNRHGQARPEPIVFPDGDSCISGRFPKTSLNDCMKSCYSQIYRTGAKPMEKILTNWEWGAGCCVRPVKGPVLARRCKRDNAGAAAFQERRRNVLGLSLPPYGRAGPVCRNAAWNALSVSANANLKTRRRNKNRVILLAVGRTSASRSAPFLAENSLPREYAFDI